MIRPVDDEGTALVQKGGAYSVAPLCEHRGMLFVQLGPNRFARAYENGSLSVPGYTISELHTDALLSQDRFGRLCVGAAGGNRRELGQATRLLLEAATRQEADDQ